jgi:hypothetical protein
MFFKKYSLKKKQFVPFLFLPVFLLGCLIRYMHKFFDIHLRVVLIYIYIYMQNLVEKTIWSMFVQESLKALGALRLLSIGRKIYFLRRVIEICTILILYIWSRHIDGYVKYFCKHSTKFFRSLQSQGVDKHSLLFTC